MKNILKKAVAIGVFLAILATGSALAATAPKAKEYEGIITQMNFSDGSFVMRMRDGSLITVRNPLLVGLYVSAKGVLDPVTNVVDKVTTMSVKDASSTTAIPAIASIYPGLGTVGTKITLTGSGFTKTKNTIHIGGIKNALLNVSSPTRQSITFTMPSAPCNQKAKLNCPTTVIAPNVYDITVENANGLSNSVPFQITPLPILGITTDILPQAMSGVKYKIGIDALGGAERYDWRVTDGKLPPGMYLAQGACSETPCKTSAIISGTTATPGQYQFTVTLTSGAETVSRQFSITVVQALNNQ